MGGMAFWGKRKKENADDGPKPAKIPSGQYLVKNFPVLTAGPTPPLVKEDWEFTIEHNDQVLGKWDWEQFRALKRNTMETDIHCVTRWSKLATKWAGVTIDALLETAGIDSPPKYAFFHSYGGYTTNLPTADLVGGKAMLADEYDGAPLEAEHGGPVRLFVPHLYFWKSAKWVKKLTFTEEDIPGFWENYGYHMYGDPWREQRFG